MNSSKSNLNNNDNGEDDNSSREDSNLDDNNPVRVFSPSPPQPSPSPSQPLPLSQPSPPPLQPLPPPSQPSRPFWNFISPSAPSISHQLMFHASTSTNARPLSYNNASALSLTLTNRPWNRSIGRGSIGESSSSSSSSHLLNQRHHYTASPAPQPSLRRRTDQLMAAAAAVPAPSQPSPFRSPPPPCTECGRRFMSSKALFGHMRCHPERTWRGINPPPNARPTAPPEDKAVRLKDFTGSELDVVEALLFLATGIEHKLERTTGTVIPGEEEDNAPLVGASSEQTPAVPDLEEDGEGGDVRSVASSSSTMRYALDLNLPPPPEEDTEGSDGSDM